ncbi:hypothetical protein PQX77_000583 [Marasmius sp. AFHP31]|nr:hypothetical protein PQX77_000583 [Marasmius sp. AFHP31]
MSGLAQSPSGSFHNFSQLTSQERTDIKRAKGQISCAECRRYGTQNSAFQELTSINGLSLNQAEAEVLKIPTKAHRHAILHRNPTGVSRKQVTVLDTATLHQKIEEMGRRIGQLEDALSLLQASVSSEQHPLLRSEYLGIKFPPKVPEDTTVEKEVFAEVVDLADEYGTLTLEEGGRTRYLGRTGGSESLMGGEGPYSAGSEPQPAHPHVSSDIKRLSRFFPFMDGPQSDSDLLKVMIGYLPDNTRARSLCEVYLTQALWSPRLIMRDELIDDILTPIYAYIESSIHEADLSLVESKPIPIPLSPHRLAVLFLVLAIGLLLDSSIPPYSTDARDFFDLGKACLSLDDILESSEPATLQALCLTGYFLNQGGPGHSPEAPWCIKGLCISLVYREVTLDSESPDWNLDPKTRNRRRTLFWEVVYLDVFYSLTLGRPPALNVSFMNCPFPDEPTEPAEAEVQKVLRWGWKFCKEVVSQIAITTLTPQIPDYATILDLDKKIREHGVPPNVKANPPSLYSRGVRLSATSWLIFITAIGLAS